MKIALRIGALFFLGGVFSSVEGPALTLTNANFSLSLPSMATRNGVVYVAYRTFDWLRSSNQLYVLAYEFDTRKELKRSLIALPKVTGARVSDGLAISLDGSMLAYVEMSEPVAIVLMRADTLSEIRRSNQLPFGEEDRRRHFAGFDEQSRLSFQSVYKDQPRFFRISVENFSRVSDITASHLKQRIFSYVVIDT